MGGHSGLNIAEGRGNAVIFAARAADAVVSGVPGARLEAIVGGDKRNAIPREASATLTVPAGAVRKTFLWKNLAVCSILVSGTGAYLSCSEATTPGWASASAISALSSQK